ncbi:MAG: tripartite tricarboxylate transporter substrate-binding protein [Betaproteobacteria bacterium]
MQKRFISNPVRIATVRILATVGAFLLLPQPAVAQERFPGKPVKFIVPTPATGPADLLARIYAQKMGERWGQAVVVENRVGATGTIGADVVSKAPPDGYTLLFTVDLPIVMAPALIKTPYDPRKGFAPVAIMAETMNMLVVHPAVGASSLAELIAVAKNKPGVLTYSSAGPASPGHLCAEMLRNSAGIDIVHVPYKGAAPAMTAVLAGEVSMFCGPVTAGLPHVKGGKLRAVGVTGSAASPLIPELAPLSATFPGLVTSNTYMLYAPPGTPTAILTQLRNDLRAVWEDRATGERLAVLGIDMLWLAGPELSRRVDADLVKWADVVKRGGIKVE